jgi:hypothetical protein
MKKVILFLFIIPVPLFCQVTDNFETGNLRLWVESVSGHWKADTTGSISGKYSLHHVFDNPLAGNDQVAIPTTNLEPSMGLTRWSFKIRHGNDPSPDNNWGVFLISDNGPSSMVQGGPVNGFVIGVNLFSGSDDILRLWKVKNGALSAVLKTGINWQNDIGTTSPVNIYVERSQEGRWKTVVSSETGSLSDSVSCIDGELFNAEWFGVYYKYTSTRDRLLWVDDISIDGVFFEDKEPPAVIKCIAYSLSSVDLTLNEEPAAGFYSASNFSLNGTGETASSILKISPVSVRVIFETRFKNKSENIIIINSLCDRSSNCTQNAEVRFTPLWAGPGDVVISEIMADPFPSVSLPEKEYLELFNRTIYPFNLKNWKLTTDASITVFPETKVYPGERKIICQLQDTIIFSKYGRVTGVKSFPVLIDAGRLLVLSDSSGSLIHGVEYSSEWYGDKMKEDGGWSLEMIDTEFPFFYEGNWAASVSGNGGTPGTPNSVNNSNPDNYFHGILNAFPGDSSYLEISFSEPVKNLEETSSGIRIESNGALNVYSSDPLMRKYILKPDNPFIRNKLYTLTIPQSLTDFAGNIPSVNSFTFGLPEKATKGDVVFNEIMFNPLPGDADYLELYNSSGNIINAAELNLVSVNESGTYSAPVPASDYNRSFLPGSYYAISINRQSILDRYISSYKENIFQVSQFPSMTDANGHLILFNHRLEYIDEVSYNEKMHYSLLSGYEGISLEKVRPSVLSTDPKNWHSASEASGWGTPGAANSIYSEQPATDDRIVFSSTRITPDNDGYEDLLVIDLKLNDNGNVVNIRIFDETGNFVRNLTDNLLAGNLASVTWDGTRDDGSLVDRGIYIVLISVFNDTGKTEKWKKVCAVIR